MARRPVVGYKRIDMRRLQLFLVVGGLVLASGCDKSEAKASSAPPKSAAAASTPGDAAPSGEATPAAPEGTVYGEALKGEQTVTIEQVMDDPKAFEGKVVRVEGMVTDVCTMRGCWFEMAGERPGMKMRFKVRDGDMVFPPSAKGKRAVAEGTVSVRTLSLEDTRKFEAHMAQDAGRDFDPESITEPMVVIQLDGRGAVISEA
ncbi:MAG: DUF4920 domain-containing protein [Myxococcales bacterium]|nr:DUF4920 domain-containing protein [Myxococcales bacterium]